MGLMDVFGALFGGGRNIVRETAEVFIENTEAGAMRDADLRHAVLTQFGAEFAAPPKASLFDRIIDGMNRLPRPAMAIGTLGLFVSAMVDPIWFAARMQGVALVPEPMWWLMGAIISFYFGARHQAKGQEFQRSIAETVARAPVVTGNLAALDALAHGAGDGAGDAEPKTIATPNPALEDWREEK